MYLLSYLFNFEFEPMQEVLRWIVTIICLISASVLLSYKRGNSRFRFFPSLLAYALTLAMFSDPIWDFLETSKPIDFTEILCRSYLLAIFIANKGNVIKPFRNAEWPKIFTFWGKGNEANQKKD